MSTEQNQHESPMTHFRGGSEEDILSIAKECGLTVIPSRTDGWWHTAYIANGKTLLGYQSRESAITDLCTYPAFRKHLVDVWKRTKQA